MRYQTEIFVASDRYVCLQLPDYLPEGRAIVTVTVAAGESPALAEPDDDRPDDVEWWEEFDDEAGDRP